MIMSRRIAALSVIFALMVTFCATVYAQDVTADTSAVSAGDVSGTDAVVSETDHLALYSLEEIEIREHRMSMLVPKMAINLTANATDDEIYNALYDSWGIGTRQELLSTFDYSNGTYYTYLYSGISANASIYIYVIYQENAYTNHIGSYAGKSAAEMESICGATDLLFGGDYSTLRTIHGDTYVCQEGEDEEYGYYSYAYETIINGGRYDIYIDLTDATQADKTVAEEIIASLRIGGRRATLLGAAESGTVTILIACVGVLAAVICLLGFFIVRFSMFSRAAGSSFNIIGFNLPPSAREIEQIMKQNENAERNVAGGTKKSGTKHANKK